MFDKKIDNTSNSYGDDAIVTLSPREHIRLRPGMYIGKGWATARRPTTAFTS